MISNENILVQGTLVARTQQGTAGCTWTKDLSLGEGAVTDVVAHGRLADHAPVRGCMVIRPHGYALWENMQRALDAMFKEMRSSNELCPGDHAS